MNNFKIHNISSFAERALQWSLTRSFLKEDLNLLQSEDVFSLPMVLRDQKFPTEVVEAALFESYSQQLLSWRDHVEKKSPFPKLNPSLMSIVLNSKYLDVDAETGLFVLWSHGGQVLALKINSTIAQIIDLGVDGNVHELRSSEGAEPQLFEFLREAGIIV